MKPELATQRLRGAAAAEPQGDAAPRRGVDTQRARDELRAAPGLQAPAATAAPTAEVEAPVVLRLPDVYAPPPVVTTPKPAASGASLSIYILTAILGLVWGFVGIDNWKAHKAAQAKHDASGAKPPQWNSPGANWGPPVAGAPNTSPPGESPPGAGPPVAKDAPHEPAPGADSSVAPAEQTSVSPSDALSQGSSEPSAGGSPTSAGGSPPSVVLPRQSSLPDKAPSYRVADRPAYDAGPMNQGSPGGGSPPGYAPGVPSAPPNGAQFEGTIVKPAPGPTYDRAQ